MRTTHIGSAIVSLPAVRALYRNAGSDCRLFLLYPQADSTEPPAIDVWKCGIPLAGRIPIRAHRRTPDLLRAALQIRRLGARTAAVINPNRFSRRTALRYRAFFRIAGVHRVIGLTGATTGSESGPTHVASLRLHRLVGPGEMADPGGVRLTLPDVARERARTWLSAVRISPHKPLVAICPGATSPANRWPHESFVEIGRRLIGLGYEIVICGGTDDTRIAKTLTQSWGGGLNAAGEFSILETAAIFEACAFFVGLDTGTTHLAAAVGIPCVVLQGGRTPRGSWDPIGEGHMVERFAVACEGCGLTHCPLSRHPCMRGISVDQAWMTILAMHARLAQHPMRTL